MYGVLLFSNHVLNTHTNPSGNPNQSEGPSTHCSWPQPGMGEFLTYVVYATKLALMMTKAESVAWLLLPDPQ